MDNPLVLINNEHPGIVIVTLNRPEKRNALNIELMEETYRLLKDFHSNPDLRALIITGNGPVFCSGLDMVDVLDPAKSHRASELVGQCLTALYNSPFVTIAAVHGAAVAGGAGLMTACDFAVAAEGTKFGYPEVRRGLVAAQVMTFLCRQLRQRDIRELLLLGEMLDAAQALRLGLINRIVPKEEIIQESLKIAGLVMKGAPAAVEQTKKLLDAMYPSVFEEDLKKGLECHRSIRDSFEGKEGVRAFLEKRIPSWESKYQ